MARWLPGEAGYAIRLAVAEAFPEPGPSALILALSRDATIDGVAVFVDALEEAGFPTEDLGLRAPGGVPLVALAAAHLREWAADVARRKKEREAREPDLLFAQGRLVAKVGHARVWHPSNGPIDFLPGRNDPLVRRERGRAEVTLTEIYAEIEVGRGRQLVEVGDDVHLVHGRADAAVTVVRGRVLGCGYQFGELSLVVELD